MPLSRPVMLVLCALSIPWAGQAMAQTPAPPAIEAQKLLQSSGFSGGLVVHLGCGDGRLTAALGAAESFVVDGLDPDPDRVARARRYIESTGRYGRVSVASHDGGRLPYAENLVNVLVAEKSSHVPLEEIMRVLAPGGVAFLRQQGGWRKVVKPWPPEIDQWTHYLHGPDGNAVADDRRVGPPRHLQWVGSPRWARAHEQMASISVVVSAGGRVFYIVDEAPTSDIAFPGQWALVARDAFNGVVLWKRAIPTWEDHRRDFRSGPPQLSRKLVAVGDRVYVTLGFRAPVTALDAATGKTVHTYPGTASAQEIIRGPERLLVAVGDPSGQSAAEAARRRGEPRPKVEKCIVAFAAGDKLLWRKADLDTAELMPDTLAVAEDKVFFQTTERIVCVDATSGAELWHTERPLSLRRPAWATPTLVVRDGVVLSADRAAPRQPHEGARPHSVEYSVSLAGGGVAGQLVAYSAQTGRQLWHCPCAENYNAPVDVFVSDGLVWAGETVRRKGPDFTTARDLHSGKIERTLDTTAAFANAGMPHHRCYRDKATCRYILAGRVGVEYIDMEKGRPLRHHWVRGTCQYGIMPANGLLYVPSNSCACYLKAKLTGFNALAAEASPSPKQAEPSASARLQRGPAYADVTRLPASAFAPLAAPAWPTYRHDAARSGATTTRIPARLTTAWTTALGGRLSPPTLADGRLFVARIDAHTVHALDAAAGKPLWRFTAGGRVDSPPTVHGPLVLFGSADGWVYCLRAADGQLAWRFRAAPAERRVMSYGQIESAWPAHGSVLVRGGNAYVTAGRSSFLDGGIRLYRLDPQSGRVLAATTICDIDPKTGRQPEETIVRFDMDGALGDVLSADAASIYMRHLRFDARSLEKQKPARHLFTPTGFLDDTWWHRSYWLYGDHYVAGWGGWWNVGNQVPSGRILSLDQTTIYGFGRDKYPGGNTGQWRGGEVYRLFATERNYPAPVPRPKGKRRGPQPPAVPERWTRHLPFLARALVLSGDTLFAAGPPEPQHRGNNPLVLADVDEALAAYHGRRGGTLRAVATNDGGKKAEYRLEDPPVFDGMIAAAGRLYLVTTAGKVVCMAGSR